MGKIKRILASKKLKPIEGNYCGIELCETVHVHMAGFRFELDIDQFKVFAETVYKALQKWISLGKPATFPYGTDGFKLLAGEYLPGEPVYANRFQIEELTVPSVHIHWRCLRISSSTPDFIEFASIIEEAKQNLNK